MSRIDGQNHRVLMHLRTKGSITSDEAREMYGIARLAARIADLRNMGCVIETERTRGKNRYGETIYYATYILMGEPENYDTDTSDS